MYLKTDIVFFAVRIIRDPYAGASSREGGGYGFQIAVPLTRISRSRLATGAEPYVELPAAHIMHAMHI